MATLVRSVIELKCSRPGCRTRFTWLGTFHEPTVEAAALDQAAGQLAASHLGWTFPLEGNVCPRPHEEAADGRDR